MVSDDKELVSRTARDKYVMPCLLYWNFFMEMKPYAP